MFLEALAENLLALILRILKGLSDRRREGT